VPLPLTLDKMTGTQLQTTTTFRTSKHFGKKERNEASAHSSVQDRVKRYQQQLEQCFAPHPAVTTEVKRWLVKGNQPDKHIISIHDEIAQIEREMLAFAQLLGETRAYLEQGYKSYDIHDNPACSEEVLSQLLDDSELADVIKDNQPRDSAVSIEHNQHEEVLISPPSSHLGYSAVKHRSFENLQCIAVPALPRIAIEWLDGWQDQRLSHNEIASEITWQEQLNMKAQEQLTE
jgi:hypothetical protein